jgi:hypothetical protein
MATLRLAKRVDRPAKPDMYPAYDGCGGAVGPQNDITTTLFTAAMELEKKLEEGAECPCCRQRAQAYCRKLNSGMAASMVWLYQSYARMGYWGWVDTGKAPKYILRSREWGKLAHWNLAKAKPNNDKAKKASGLWKPTPYGMSFARGLGRVPSHVHLYDNKVLGFSGDEISVVEALGSKFDYEELMRTR